MTIVLKHHYWAAQAIEQGANLRRATAAEIAAADPALHAERARIARAYGADRAPDFYVRERNQDA